MVFEPGALEERHTAAEKAGAVFVEAVFTLVACFGQKLDSFFKVVEDEMRHLVTRLTP